MNKKKILIASAVCQDVEILKEFLQSLKSLIKNSYEVGYFFVDDNKNEGSSELLLNFQKENNNVILYEGYKEKSESYNCDEYTHYWTKNLVEKVTIYKNFIINYCMESDYSYLFFIDSDIVLHPKTLERIFSLNKDIISNIFWTKWGTNTKELPQVWQQDNYSFFKYNSMDELLPEDIKMAEEEFLEMLKVPGTYKVGGLGACTLIKREVLEKGVNFSKLYNLSYWGEDRHFCIRAVANNFDLYVDTYYPAYHIYRKENLVGLEKFKENIYKRDIDILTEQLMAIVKKAIVEYKTVDGKNKSWEIFFKEENLENFKNQKNLYNGKVIKGEFQNSIKILGYDMRLNEKFNEFSGYLEFMEHGYFNEKSFYNEKKVFCKLEKNKKNQWRVTEISKEEILDIEEKPFERRVRENPKIVLSMIVKNEENRYLEKLLKEIKPYIEDYVIIDDNSTDNTVKIIEEQLEGKSLRLIKNKESLFNHEWKLRKIQWENTIEQDPDWILFLDADEFLEKKFLENLNILILDKDTDSFAFRLYDMWNEEFYREDNLWNAHRRFSPFLIRYQPEFNYEFKETKQHCGRLPKNILELPSKNSLFRVKHYGWAKESDRLEKYERYRRLDPEGLYGNLKQYESILDEEPKLVKWVEEK